MESRIVANESLGKHLVLSHDLHEDLTFLDLLIIVAQRKKLIASMAIFGALIALAIAMLLRPQYTATVVVLPPPPAAPTANAIATQSDGSGVTADNGSTGKELPTAKDTKKKGASGRRDLNEMYVAILQSRSVEDAVIQRYGLMGQYHANDLSGAREALERRTKIDGSNRDGLIRLSFSDRDPNRAAEIANGYIEQFRALSQHLVLSEPASEAPFVQVVDAAAPPERWSSPNRTRITVTGAALGLTIGAMLALLQGGLVRLRSNSAMREKLDLLKSSVFARQALKSSDGSEAGALRTKTKVSS
jgi:tyrosine-protein kinase Etk/Wzc